MPTLISSLFLIAALAQEPAAKLNLGEQWLHEVQAQAAVEESRALNAVGGEPLLIWLSTTGPICSISANGLPTSGTFLAPTAVGSPGSSELGVESKSEFTVQLPTVFILPYSPAVNNETIQLRIEPGTAGSVVLRVAKLESVIQYARQQWPNFDQELPAEALRGMLQGADIRLQLHAERATQADGTVSPPPWLRGLIQLLQTKAIAADGRSLMRTWWEGLMASKFQLSAGIQTQIQEAIGTLYEADGQYMRAILQYRTAAIQAKQGGSTTGMTSALNRLEGIAQELPSAEAIYANLSDLAGMEMTTPSLAYLLAEAQWEMGLFEEAQQNLWTVQKSLLSNQGLGSHCRVHHLLGAVAMELEQWKMARYHFEQAIDSGEYYLRDTPATTTAHQQVRVVLAEAFARHAKVLDRVMAPAEADRMLASALRTLPHRGATHARLLTLEIAAQMALQRGRISSARSNLLKAEEVMANSSLDADDWRGRRGANERFEHLAALTTDLAWASSPGGRGKGVWHGMAAVDRWTTHDFSSKWSPAALVRDLPQDVAVVQYTRGLTHLYAFRADATGVMMWRLGNFASLQKQWTNFLESLEQADGDVDLKAYLKDSFALYDKLLKPLVRKSDRQLWISLPPAMQSVPLTALADSSGQAYRRLKSLADASLVVKHLAVAYVDTSRCADLAWQKMLDARRPRQARLTSAQAEVENPALAFQRAQLAKLAEDPAPLSWVHMQYPGN